MARPLIPATLISLLLLFVRFSLASPHQPLHQVSPVNSLLPRQSSTGSSYSCDASNPCSNGACCGKSGYCGYGPTYCGTTGTSPNAACWSNCNAHAECGQYAVNPGQGCPLNVCCSQFGFCGTTSDFCGTGCQSNCNQPSSGASNGNIQQRIVGYYESWAIPEQCMGMNIQQIPVESLTHLNYAFGYIVPGTFEIGPMPGTDPSTFSDFTALKSRNPSLVAGISIGGWSFNDNGTTTQPVFGNIVSSAANRKTFINNLMSFMKHYGFDAVDIDWEYPGAPDRQPNQANSAADGENYVLLLQEMKSSFASQPYNWQISFTAPTSYWYLRWFNITEMIAAADYVNLMTYDLHGVWDANDPIGNQILAHTNLTEIGEALDLLWRNNVPPAKVNLGLAFYSRTFQLQDSKCTTPGCPFSGGGMAGACTKNSGTLSYREITDVLASGSITPTYDKTAGVKYFTWNTNQWASYDDEETFQQKIAFANEQGLGGLLIWSLDQDDSNLDALRGVLYPATLKDSNEVANNVAYWQNQQPGACSTTTCGGSCSPGTIEITTVACPSGGKHPQKLCCPISSAPDPSTCQWRGNPRFCNGQCHGGEVALASSVDGGNGHCHDGRQFYCCPIPEAEAGQGINCGWKDTCSSDQTLMTFAGTFLEDLDPVVALGGLVGSALASALDQLDIKNQKRYCCSNDEAPNWKDCYWAGTTGKGFSSCDDDHCATGIEVELTTSFFGDGQTCAPMLGRQRAFCCTPASGQSLFLPVPLDDLFPNPPNLDAGDPIFNLVTDDTWGTGKTLPGGQDDPDHASFGFVVITAPAEVQVSLSRRDGSPWELFDCFDAHSEEEQTIRMICTDESPDSGCNDILLGDGAPGTILTMPDGCGPGRYAVAKSMELSENQSLPAHLAKRSFGSARIYDLTFDYNFARVPRTYGDSQMRLDFSNEEGYWNAVVDRPGQRKTKRGISEFHGDRKRWLEDEWRDAYHHGGMTREEIHKRWFGSDVLSWLANLVGVGQAEVTEELNHSVDEILNIILIDQQFSCPVGAAQASASVQANLKGQVTVDSSFGLTIIATLAFPPDLKNSYLYFKNKGKITATFTLDAVASISYSSGDIKLIGLDDFPGATFRVPGVVTVGPNIAVYASADAAVTIAGHLEADITIAEWEIQQTYPQNVNYPVDPINEPDYNGTQTIGVPTFEASVTATGEVALHLKPEVTFGIVFDSRWGVDPCSVSLVLDGYIIFHAEASLSTGGDNSCPFTYGIDAGSDLYAQLSAPSLFGWGGQQQFSIASVPRKQITPEICPATTNTKSKLRRNIESGYLLPNETALASTSGQNLNAISSLGAAYIPDLMKRTDTFNLGPLITIPSGFLSCPSTTNQEDNSCPYCSSTSASFKKRQDGGGSTGPEEMACPWLPQPQDDSCTVTAVDKRGQTTKTISLSWAGKFPYSYYPSCSASDLSSVSGVSKWYMPENVAQSSCTPKSAKYNKDASQNTVQGISISEFATDHVFEVHLISDFLEWLCNTNAQLTYTSGTIPFPTGWGRPNSAWCSSVFGGSTGGFQFPAYVGDANSESFVFNTASYLGGISNLGLLALYLGENNGLKGKWTAANSITLGGLSDTATVNLVKDSANVFDYLKNSVQSAWTGPSNSVEQIADAFDQYFWTSGFVAGGTPLTRPATPTGVTHWGLRTLWCYWIDRHSAKIEERVGGFLQTANTILKGRTGGSAKVVSNFLAKEMSGAGLATTAQMTLPRANNFAAIALPGTPGSATTTSSRYLMWGVNNNFGKLGL